VYCSTFIIISVCACIVYTSCCHVLCARLFILYLFVEMSLDKYCVFRPVDCGRVFNFYDIRNVSVYCGNPAGNLQETAVLDCFWPDPATDISNEYNGTYNAYRVVPSNLKELLFNTNNWDDCLLSRAKSPDLFSYYTCVPVYYGFRVTLKRAYLQVYNLLGEGRGFDLQTGLFSSNNDNGVDCDLMYYFDSQNMNSVYQFCVPGDYTTPSIYEHLVGVYNDRRFSVVKHRVDGSSIFNINVGCQLPPVTTVITPHLMKVEGDLTASLRSYFAGNVSNSVTTLQSPGDLYLSFVRPYNSDLFVNMFVNAERIDEDTYVCARMIYDFSVVTKFSVRCSNRLPSIKPWVVDGGTIPVDVIPVV
jgi:hypothetical protein